MRTPPEVRSKRLAISLFAGALCLALAACDTGGVFQGEPGPWDGRWTGRILFSVGHASCVRRGAVRVTVDRGNLTGDVRGSAVDFGMRGRVLESGELSKGFLTRHANPVADLTGQFADDTFEGRWNARELGCRGTISMRRATTR